jgi:hypothetical protein
MHMNRVTFARACARAKAMARVGCGPAAVWRSPEGIYTVGYLAYPRIGLGRPVHIEV